MKRKLFWVILVVVAVVAFRSWGKTKEEVTDVHTSWEKEYEDQVEEYEEEMEKELADYEKELEDEMTELSEQLGDMLTEDVGTGERENVAEGETIIEESAPEPTESPVEEPLQTEEDAGISPEFKEAMDSYEEFFDEYIVFMEKYADAEGMDALGMMEDYMDYMAKYSETMEALNAIGEEDMNTAEALYYSEVMTRISAKLLTVAE